MYLSNYSQSQTDGEANDYPQTTLQPEYIPGIGAIFHRYYKPLQEAARRIVRIPIDAEDIAMTVIYKVATAKKQPKTIDHLRNLLFVSTRNESIDLLGYRSQQKKIAFDLLYGHHSPKLYFPAACPCDQEVCWPQLLATEIKSLTPQQQKVLQMYFYYDKTTWQIAAELHISRQTVLNHKARALETLRNSRLKNIWHRWKDS